MKFSVVVPSLNQGRFLRAALDSLLAQGDGGVELEPLVFDAGSTDGSVDILRSYGRMLHWVSRPDKGQADAINQGLRAGDGEVFGYLNSDDVLLPGALRAVAAHFQANPGSLVVYGDALHLDADGRTLGPYATERWNYGRLLEKCYLCQPAVFWRREATERFGAFDDQLQYAMDYEYWLRLGRQQPFDYLPGRVLAGSRLHGQTKTLSRRLEVHRETLAVVHRFEPHPYPWLRSVAHLEAETRYPFHRRHEAERRRYLECLVERALHHAERLSINLDESFLRELHWRLAETELVRAPAHVKTGSEGPVTGRNGNGWTEEVHTEEAHTPAFSDRRRAATLEPLLDHPINGHRNHHGDKERHSGNGSSGNGNGHRRPGDLLRPPPPIGVEDKDFTGHREAVKILARLRALLADPRLAAPADGSGRALDFGCGEGGVTRALGEWFDDVVGVDFSPAALGEAGKLESARANGEKRPARCRFLRLPAGGEEPRPGDPPGVRLLPRALATGSFHLVLGVGKTLGALHPTTARLYLRELARLLRPGGLLACRLPADAADDIVLAARRAPRRAAVRALPRAGFRARLETPLRRLELPAGSTAAVPLRLTNFSPVAWPALGWSDGTFRVAVGNHWLDREGRRVVVQDDGRVHLAADLEPDASAELAVRVRAPMVAGDYQLEFDAVQEHVCWFTQRGSAPLRLAVTVHPHVNEGNVPGHAPLLPPVPASPGAESPPMADPDADLSRAGITALLLGEGGRVLDIIDEEDSADVSARGRQRLYLFQKASVQPVLEVEAMAAAARQWREVVAYYRVVAGRLAGTASAARPPETGHPVSRHNGSAPPPDNTLNR